MFAKRTWGSPVCVDFIFGFDPNIFELDPNVAAAASPSGRVRIHFRPDTKRFSATT